MKIAIVVPFFPSLSQTFILNEITGLIERGCEVSIFSQQKIPEIDIHSDIIAYDLLGRTTYLVCPVNKFRRIILSVPLLYLGLKNNPRLLFKSLNCFRYGKIAFSLSLLYKIIPFLKGYDIIHCHFGTTGNFGAQLKKIGVPGKLITTFHGFDIRLAIENGPQIYNELFKYGHQFIATTEYIYRNLIEFGLDKNKIISHMLGINTKNFSPGKSPPIKRNSKKIDFLTIARLVPEKGLKYAIDAINKLHHKYPNQDIKYHIIGDGPLRDEISAYISMLGLKKIILLHGGQKQEIIIDMLRKSDVFILPSVAESFGIVLLEAQAIGLPVIATSVGSTYQAMKNGVTGYLVPPKDSNAIANRLINLMNNPNERIAMGFAGRKFVTDNFGIEMLNDHLLEIYEDLLAKS